MLINHPIIQKLNDALFDKRSLSVEVLRLDLIDPEVSGNKWFKLHLNLERAVEAGYKTVITFGGAFSNHIASTAAACKLYGLKAIGIIRGEELSSANNQTLSQAKENGMHIHFVNREVYNQKGTQTFQEELLQRYGPHYLVPEGGNNAEGVLGCAEIVKPEWQYDYVICACGTGTTFSGIAGVAPPSQVVVGISVLKGENNLPVETSLQINSVFPYKQIKVAGNEDLESTFIDVHCITNNYCFNGYAKYNSELVAFKNNFETKFNIPLDYIYTNKLFYAVYDLAEKGKLQEGTTVLIIHSGGLQGNRGFEASHHSKF